MRFKQKESDNSERKNRRTKNNNRRIVATKRRIQQSSNKAHEAFIEQHNKVDNIEFVEFSETATATIPMKL